MLIHNVRSYVESLIRTLQIFLDAIVTYFILFLMLRTAAKRAIFLTQTFFEWCSGDTELFRIGELSFNEQFAAMETVPQRQS